MAPMRRDGRGQIDQDVELLLLTGARDGQQALHRAFTVLAARAKTDFPPLDRDSQGSFRLGMPRAGLCRVAEFTPVDVGFHLRADAA